MTKSKDARNHDPYPPSHASLLVAKCLEEGGGRSRDHKTNSLPLNSALVSFDQSDTNAAKSTSLDKYYKGEKPRVKDSFKDCQTYDDHLTLMIRRGPAPARSD